MERLKAFAPFEATLLAAGPALAILVAYLYQFGSYGALGVPFELIELSTPKIIVSIIALTFFFWFYAVVWMENGVQLKPKTWQGLVGWHLLLNFFMSAMFWFRPYASLSGNLVAMVAFTGLLTSATLWGRWIFAKRKLTGRSVSLLTRSTFFGYCTILVFLVSTASGMNSEYKQTSRLIVKGTSLAFIGSYAGQYILIPFDPKTLTLKDGSVTLMAPNGLLYLERRNGVRLNR